MHQRITNAVIITYYSSVMSYLGRYFTSRPLHCMQASWQWSAVTSCTCSRAVWPTTEAFCIEPRRKTYIWSRPRTWRASTFSSEPGYSWSALCSVLYYISIIVIRNRVKGNIVRHQVIEKSWTCLHIHAECQRCIWCCFWCHGWIKPAGKMSWKMDKWCDRMVQQWSAHTERTSKRQSQRWLEELRMSISRLTLWCNMQLTSAGSESKELMMTMMMNCYLCSYRGIIISCCLTEAQQQ